MKELLLQSFIANNRTGETKHEVRLCKNRKYVILLHEKSSARSASKTLRKIYNPADRIIHCVGVCDYIVPLSEIALDIDTQNFISAQFHIQTLTK